MTARAAIIICRGVEGPKQLMIAGAHGFTFPGMRLRPGAQWRPLSLTHPRSRIAGPQARQDLRLRTMASGAARETSLVAHLTGSSLQTVLLDPVHSFRLVCHKPNPSPLVSTMVNAFFALRSVAWLGLGMTGFQKFPLGFW